MRHRVYGYKLGRDKDQRSRLFRSLVSSLFTYGTIETSQTKAKAIKGLVDKIINLAKNERSSSSNKNRQRLLQSFLIDQSLRERVIKEIAPKLTDRVSGYTKLVRLGERLGDRSMRVRMSIIHNEQLKPVKEAEPIKKEEAKGEKSLLIKPKAKKGGLKKSKLKSQRSKVKVKNN